MLHQGDALARANGLSRSKFIEILIEQALAADSLWHDAKRIQERADHPFAWKASLDEPPKTRR